MKRARFAFSLCLAIGCPHPELLPLSVRQVAEWQAYAALEPWGETRADLRQMVSLAYHMALAGGNRGEPLPKQRWPYWPDQDETDALYDAWRELTKTTGAGDGDQAK